MSNLICRVNDGSIALTKKSLKNGVKADGQEAASDLIHVSTTCEISRLSRWIRTSAFPMEDRVLIVETPQ